MAQKKHTGWERKHKRLVQNKLFEARRESGRLPPQVKKRAAIR